MGTTIDVLDQHVNVGMPASGSQLQQFIKLLWSRAEQGRAVRASAEQGRAGQGGEGLSRAGQSRAVRAAARGFSQPWTAERSRSSQV